MQLKGSLTVEGKVYSNGLKVGDGATEPSPNMLLISSTDATNTERMRIEGANGTLFSISDEASGTLLAVTDTSGTEMLTVTDMTHVGINQPNPQYTLDVDGIVNTTGNVLVGGHIGVGRDPGTWGIDSVDSIRTSGAFYQAGGTRLGAGNLYSPTNLSIKTYDGSTEKTRMYIEAVSGKIGINTLAPTDTLTVNGGIRAYGSSIISDQDALINGNIAWHAGNFDPADYLATVGGTLTGNLTMSGGYRTLSVGDAGGQLNLHNNTSLAASSNLLDIKTSQSLGISFKTGTAGNETERIRILQDGNVGIGIDAPTELLHVNGNAIISGTLDTTLKPPAPPTNLVLVQGSDYVQLSWDLSPDTVDAYEVWSSINTSDDFGLLAVIPGSDVSTDMIVSDKSYTGLALLYYRVYAVRNGVRSTALTGNIVANNQVADVSNLKVDYIPGAYVITFNLPDDRRLANVRIAVDKDANQGNLSEGSAVTVYTGITECFVYKVPDADKDLYHQFWVYTTTAT